MATVSIPISGNTCGTLRSGVDGILGHISLSVGTMTMGASSLFDTSIDQVDFTMVNSKRDRHRGHAHEARTSYDWAIAGGGPLLALPGISDWRRTH